MIHPNKVCSNIRFDILKYTINISDVYTWRSNEFSFIIIAHRYNNLVFEEYLVIMLILGLFFLELLIILWMFSIFLVDKLFLSFRISLILGANAYIYDFLGFSDLLAFLPLLLKNFDFSKTFLDGLTRIEEGSLTTSTCLSFDCLALLINLILLILGEILDTMFYLIILLFLLVVSVSQPDL